MLRILGWVFAFLLSFVSFFVVMMAGRIYAVMALCVVGLVIVSAVQDAWRSVRRWLFKDRGQ